VAAINPPAADRRYAVLLSRLLGHWLEKSAHSYMKQLRCCRRRLKNRSVHQLRGQVRRLLAGLNLLDELISDRTVRKARAALKNQFGALGDLRDVQQQLRRLDRQLPHNPNLRQLCHHLQRRKRRLSRLVRGSLKAVKPARWFASVSQRLVSLPAHPRLIQGLRSRVSKALLASLNRAILLLPRHAADLSRLHRARIAIKRYRDLAELLQSAGPRVDARLLTRLDNQQAVMGKVHDLQLFMARLKKWALKGKLTGKELRAVRASLARRRSSLVAAYFLSTRQLLRSVKQGGACPSSS
jgi:CHAD domain-containing protein